MKAWKVNRKDDIYCTVVFAETRAKAKVEAMYSDCCEDAQYIEIEARRVPALDAYYNGRSEMDWYNAQDRIHLVKEVGMTCEEVDVNECRECPACAFCDPYLDFLAETAKENDV